MMKRRRPKTRCSDSSRRKRARKGMRRRRV